MSTHPTPPLAASHVEPSHPDRAHWTSAKQRIFLAALLDSGSVARAARAAAMSRSSAHRLRARLAGSPFDLAWSRAVALHERQLANPFLRPPGASPSAPDASEARR